MERRKREEEEEERVEAAKATSLDPFNLSLDELYAPKAAPRHLTSSGGAASLQVRTQKKSIEVGSWKSIEVLSTKHQS